MEFPHSEKGSITVMNLPTVQDGTCTVQVVVTSNNSAYSP